MRRLVGLILAAFLGSTAFAANPALPAWFPTRDIFTVNPDQITTEDFGAEEFTLASGKTVEAKGHHWKASLYAPGPNATWNGGAAWAKLRPQLEQQGFKVVYLKTEGGGVDATLLRGNAERPTYVSVALTADDGFGNSVAIIETSASARTLVLTRPAATPERFGDKDNFPSRAPLAGARLLNTLTDASGPLDVSTSSDAEPRLVGSGTVMKEYEGPSGLSDVEFVNTYDSALGVAGWTTSQKRGGSLLAHFEGNGRDLWTHIYRESQDRWNIVVADVGAQMRSGLAQGCRVPIYGVNFNFNKATLRADAEPVLRQLLAALQASAQVAVEIGGHTDNVGKPDYNLQLSQGRAESVKAWLVAHGIGTERLSSRGYGDTAPVVPNSSDINRARNRRVELKKPRCP